MPEEAFERYRNALVAARLEKPNMLQGLASKFWSEITSQYYEFDRDNVEVDALKTITKQDLCEFFEVILNIKIKIFFIEKFFRIKFCRILRIDRL